MGGVLANKTEVISNNNSLFFTAADDNMNVLKFKKIHPDAITPSCENLPGLYFVHPLNSSENFTSLYQTRRVSTGLILLTLPSEFDRAYVYPTPDIWQQGFESNPEEVLPGEEIALSVTLSRLQFGEAPSVKKINGPCLQLVIVKNSGEPTEYKNLFSLEDHYSLPRQVQSIKTNKIVVPDGHVGMVLPFPGSTHHIFPQLIVQENAVVLDVPARKSFKRIRRNDLLALVRLMPVHKPEKLDLVEEFYLPKKSPSSVIACWLFKFLLIIIPSSLQLSLSDC